MIRKAEINEYEAILDFYYKLIDDMQGMKYHPKWQKGIYPNDDDVKSALDNSEMIVCTESNHIIAAMKVNHEVTDGYEKVKWAVSAKEEEVTVIHMLGVSALHQEKGIGKKMVQFVIDTAKSQKQKAIRLDVMTGNIPANKLYESMGFEYRDKITLFYEDTGFMDFELYELVL